MEALYQASETPDIMRTERLLPLLATGLCFLHTPIAAHASGDDGMVEIRGRILTDQVDPNGLLLVVEVDGEACLPFTLRGDGRFALRLPVGSKALLHFELDGCLTKEILVDTKNALATERAAERNNTVRFDVLMTPPPPERNVAYGGPVGNIRFVNGTGLMHVHYDRDLVHGVAAGTTMVH